MRLYEGQYKYFTEVLSMGCIKWNIYDVVLKLKKIVYVQAEFARLWYEKFINGLLERGLVKSKVYPCLLISKTVVCVVYVDDCIFWAHSQYEIDNVIKYFNNVGPSYNWEHSKLESVSELLGIDIHHHPMF